MYEIRGYSVIPLGISSSFLLSGALPDSTQKYGGVAIGVLGWVELVIILHCYDWLLEQIMWRKKKNLKI